jgi:phosphoribosylformylglycinamidine synthase
MLRVAIIQFPGSNCEYEARRAVNAVGMEGVLVRWNEDYEKIRLLREEIAGSSAATDREKLEKLTAFLATVNYKSEAGADYYQEKVRQGKELLEQLSR